MEQRVEERTRKSPCAQGAGASGPSRGPGDEPDEGRVPRDPLARVAHTAQRDLGWAHILEVGPRDPRRSRKRSGPSRTTPRRSRSWSRTSSTCRGYRRQLNCNLGVGEPVIGDRTGAGSGATGRRCERDPIAISLDDVAPLIVDRDRLQQVMWNCSPAPISSLRKMGRCGWASRRVLMTWSSRSLTPAGDQRPSCRMSSSGSRRRTARWRVSMADWGWAWPSSATWWNCTAAA